MATRSSSRLQLVPEKLKNYSTELDEKNFSRREQKTDDIFGFRKTWKEIMESKRRGSSSGASCDGVSLGLYLALFAIFASITLYHIMLPCIIRL